MEKLHSILVKVIQDLVRQNLLFSDIKKAYLIKVMSSTWLFPIMLENPLKRACLALQVVSGLILI